MRNLLLSQNAKIVIDSLEVPDLSPKAVSLDSSTGDIYCAFGPSNDYKVIEIQKINKEGISNSLALIDLQDSGNDDNNDYEKSNEEISVCDIKYLEQSDSVSVLLDNGDIYLIGSNSNGELSLVGSLSDKILAYSWSPDNDRFVVLTRSMTIAIFTSSFDLISEVTLSFDDLSYSANVSVGWGKKETQFIGKGAKGLLKDPTVQEVIEEGKFSPMDNKISSTISWRGDCEYFAVSTVTPLLEKDNNLNTNSNSISNSQGRRAIRVYNRDGERDSVSEPKDFLESPMSWRPSGNLISTIQRTDSNINILFFERNGLAHGQFDTRLDPSNNSEKNIIKSIQWNILSDVLAIHVDNTIQLWTSSNYHWSLKTVLKQPTNEKIISFQWFTERPYSLLLLCDNSVQIAEYTPSLFSGPTTSPYDLGTTIVIDGNQINISPLGIVNIPPPLYYKSFNASDIPLHVAIDQSNKIFSVLTHDSLELFNWNLKGNNFPDIVKKNSFKINEIFSQNGNHFYPQMSCIFGNWIAILGVNDKNSCISFLSIPNDATSSNFNLENIQSSSAKHLYISNKVFRLFTNQSFDKLFYFNTQGDVYMILLTDDVLVNTEFICKLPPRCDWISAHTSSENDLTTDFASTQIFALGCNGKLYLNGEVTCSGIRSAIVSNDYIIVITIQNFLKFARILRNDSIEYSSRELVFPDDSNIQNDERIRQVERGARLISVAPSNSSIIMQMPRGNLETIYPRLLVLGDIRENIKAKDYKQAFSKCKVHRIDFNILYDYDPIQFMENIKDFIMSIGIGTNLDLFLASLKEEDVTKTKYQETSTLQSSLVSNSKNILDQKDHDDNALSKVNTICTSIIDQLKVNFKSSKKYEFSLLTAQLCKNPPDVKAALQHISKENPNSDIDTLEPLLEHITFLHDVNDLYEKALEIYDVPLTLMVAQQSQKDPKEYIPFLQNLQAQKDEYKRRFLIDDYLKFYEKAIENLSLVQDENFDVVLDYIILHKLYKKALQIYKKNEEKRKLILMQYANYLYDEHKYTESGLAYETLEEYEQALNCFKLAGKWREALTLSYKVPNMTKDERIELANDLVENLIATHRYNEAAVVYREYLDDITESIKSLCKAYLFNEAFRIAYVYQTSSSSQSNLSQESILNLIESGIIEGYSQFSELIAECSGQINAQLLRLKELRAKKLSNPMAFYEGAENEDAPDNVSITSATTGSNQSIFTRYTGKTGVTAGTGVSRRTSKNRRREERKRARGKKGSIYEEEYLINSIGRLIDRVNESISDCSNVIIELFKIGRIEQASDLESRLCALIDTLKKNVKDVFTISEKDRERYDDEGNMYYIPEKTIPEIKTYEPISF